MAKTRKVYSCSECGASAPTWTGRCARCGGWATVGESAELPERRSAAHLVPLGTLSGRSTLPVPTGFDEVDRVLGGGLAPGSVTLLHGEPGIGKSTLTLQMAMRVASTGASVILVSGEEAPSQIASRAERLGPIPPTLVVLDETGVGELAASISSDRPQMMIVDSIQTVRADESDSPAGSSTQIRRCTQILSEAAKRADVSLLLIGHVTKDGVVAGPRVLEHLVDTVLAFTGDRTSDLRFLRAVKHRFGPTDETGLFEMGGDGLRAVSDPSQRFLADRPAGVPGSVVVPVVEGRRPILVEIQALVTRSGEPSVTVQGLPSARVKMILAVLEEHTDVSFGDSDVFLSVAGGAAVDEPGADLGIALALVSARLGVPVQSDLVVCGEVGLAGEIRRVAQQEARQHEMFRLGFRTSMLPASAIPGPTGLRLIRVNTIGQALSATRRVVPAIH